MVYFFVFVLSTISTYFAQKNFEHNNKKSGIFFSIIAIGLPSILAGVRDNTVGTDVKVYVESWFNIALRVKSLPVLIEGTSSEIGYATLTYIVSLFTDDLHWLLFIIQLIICMSIFIIAYKRREQLSMWLVMFVYYTNFYNITLNIARQSIAVACVFFAMYLFEKRKYMFTLLITFVAILFHTTAVFSLIVYIIFYIMDTKKINLRDKKILLIIIMTLCIFIVLFYDNCLKFITYNLGFISEKYYAYLSNEKFLSYNININWSAIGFRMLWIVGFGLYIKVKGKCKEKKYLILLIIELLMFFVSFKVSNATRMGYYFGITSLMLTIPKINIMFKKDKFNRLIVNSVIIGILTLYWWYIYIFLNSCDTYPYVSDVLKFL